MIASNRKRLLPPLAAVLLLAVLPAAAADLDAATLS